MPQTFIDRLQHAWAAFTSRDPTGGFPGYGYGGYERLDRYRPYFSNDQSIVTMIENRIAVDCAQVNIRHIKRDDKGRYVKEMDSHLNKALSVSANIDQSGRAFIQDLVQSMLDEGCAVAVPVAFDINGETSQIEFESLRVGKVIAWYPQHVRMQVYNDKTGRREEMIAPKTGVAIVENPFHAIMNEENSTLKRLIKTLRSLDVVNEKNASGKLDLIIQHPYQLATDRQQTRALATQKRVEEQLSTSKYGIAYIDAAERITQLNRPVDNNLWIEAQDLTNMLFNHLGLTQSVFDGTASEATMNNYYNRTVEPILTAIVEEMERKFLTPTARTQHQAIVYIRDPFKLVGVTDIANMAKIFTETEVMSSNEVRSKIGFPPVDDKRADQLVNKNINKVEDTVSGEQTEVDEEIQNVKGKVKNGKNV